MSKPILKWAGGKTQLLPIIIENMPANYNDYCEPFIGSASLLFYIKPKKAIINDFNPQLICLYQNIKNNPDKLKASIDKLTDSFNNSNDKKEFYYSKRNEFNKYINSNSIKASSLLVFINKTCFNGLYRLNSNGKFNVPFSKREHLNSLTSNIYELSGILQNVDMKTGDFEDACKGLKKNDFVYFDPPYYNTFVDYQADGFGKESQIRLANLFKKLSKKGVYCLLSNSNDKFIYKLYEGFNIKEIKVHRNINRNGKERYGTEVLIKNYE